MSPWNIGIGQAPANLRTRDTFLQSMCMGVAASGLFTLFDISGLRMVEISIKTMP
jgi:hypothetical protein